MGRSKACLGLVSPNQYYNIAHGLGKLDHAYFLVVPTIVVHDTTKSVNITASSVNITRQMGIVVKSVSFQQDYQPKY